LLKRTSATVSDPDNPVWTGRWRVNALRVDFDVTSYL
jgi:hypothetical protein